MRTMTAHPGLLSKRQSTVAMVGIGSLIAVGIRVLYSGDTPLVRGLPGTAAGVFLVGYGSYEYRALR